MDSRLAQSISALPDNMVGLIFWLTDFSVNAPQRVAGREPPALSGLGFGRVW